MSVRKGSSTIHEAIQQAAVLLNFIPTDTEVERIRAKTIAFIVEQVMEERKREVLGEDI